MLRFRELLFLVGALRVILGAEPYTSSSSIGTVSYPSAVTYPVATVYPNPASYSGGLSYPSPADASYGYMQYGGVPAYSPAYGQGGYGANPYGASQYGGYNNNNGNSGYSSSTYGRGNGYETGTNCSALRVIDVLDQIFCQHGRRKRYSTNIYQYTGLIVRQIEYIMEFVFLQAAYDYLGAAVQTLKTIQDSLYNNFEHSSLLNPYFEDFRKTQGTSETASSTSRESVKAKTEEARTKIKQNEQNAQMFKTNKGISMQSSGSQVHASNSQQEETSTHTKSDAAAKKRSTFLEINLAQLGTNADPKKAEKINKLKKRMAHLQTKALNESRKARDVKYSDYGCTYVAPATCNYDKYDELLYNLLERFFTALDFIIQACDETWFFMDEISCEDEWDRWAIIEAAAVYGSIVTDTWTLFDEVIIPVEEMYELIELEYAGQGSNYFRAAGDSYSQSQSQPSPTSYQVPMMRRPMNYGRPPYSFSQYMSQKRSQNPQYSGYSPPSQYRGGRGVVQPISVPLNLHNGRGPSVYVVG